MGSKISSESRACKRRLIFLQRTASPEEPTATTISKHQKLHLLQTCADFCPEPSEQQSRRPDHWVQNSSKLWWLGIWFLSCMALLYWPYHSTGSHAHMIPHVSTPIMKTCADNTSTLSPEVWNLSPEPPSQSFTVSDGWGMLGHWGSAETLHKQIKNHTLYKS